MMLRSLTLPVMLVAATCSAMPEAIAECPSRDAILESLERLDLGAASRTVRFESEFPEALYGKAAANLGEAVAAREGDQGYGVMVVEIPVERLWIAVSDEEHQTVDLPIRHSEVIDGTPRGETRTVFQHFKKWGIGRWWVSRVTMNRDLYEASGGKLWETYWVDVMAEVDPQEPPFDQVASDMKPIAESRGSWLFVPLNDSCTLIEYFHWTDPGGVVGATQWIMAKRMIRSTMTGMARMAERHAGEPHPGAPFVRPDGTPLK